MARTTENPGRRQARFAGRSGRGGQSGRRMWDARELKALRDGAGSSRGAGAIATQLGRTEAAIRNKASKEGIYFTADRGSSGSRPAGRRGRGSRKATSRRGGTRSRLH